MNPRRYSQIERALNILDKSGTVDILQEDQYLLFLFKKTERVAAALYVVTGLFPDGEPLKWGLRESGVLLIKHTLSFKERATVHSKEFLSDTFAEMAHLFSLLDLAYVADLLSPMNFSVLKKELENVLGIIEGKWRISSFPISPPFLEESFFGIPKDIFSSTNAKEGESEILFPFSPGAEQHAEGDTAIHGFGEFERFKRNQKDIYKGHADSRENVLNKKTQVSRSKTRIALNKEAVVSPLSNQTKEDRKQNILAVLRQQHSAMIKNFSAVIRGCSEKTIQRLLTRMVQDGVLKREGDRRWSRYSIFEQKQKKVT